MRRLRDIHSGDTYGWNYEMAKLDYLEEFDDEDDTPFEPQPVDPVDKVLPHFPLPPTPADEHLDEDLAAAVSEVENEIMTDPAPATKRKR